MGLSYTFYKLNKKVYLSLSLSPPLYVSLFFFLLHCSSTTLPPPWPGCRQKEKKKATAAGRTIGISDQHTLLGP